MGVSHPKEKYSRMSDYGFVVPYRASVNNGIDSDLCSLKYVTVDKVAEIVHRLGRGTLTVKVDIEVAYRLVPVHSEDCGVQIDKECFCD